MKFADFKLSKQKLLEKLSEVLFSLSKIKLKISRLLRPSPCVCACRARGMGRQRGEGVKFFVFRPLFRPALVFRFSLIFSSAFFLVPTTCVRTQTNANRQKHHIHFRFRLNTLSLLVIFGLDKLSNNLKETFCHVCRIKSIKVYYFSFNV